MKKLSELIEEYYKNPALKELEKKRKSLFFRLKAVFVFIASVYVVLVIYIKPGMPDIIYFTTALAVIYGFIYYFLSRNYKKQFKKEVISSLIKIFSKDIKYFPDLKIDPVKYELSGLFPHRYDKYEGEDYVKGKIEGVDFEFSDIHTQFKTRDSKGNIHWNKIFKGTFFVSKFNKKFKGRVLVYPDYSEKFLGSLANSFQKLNSHNLEFVKMDSPEFEKEFVIYSDDQILARYVLSTALMEKIMKFKKAIKKPLYFSFKNNMMFVAISGNNNFEAPVFRSLTDYSFAEEMIGGFYYISTLIKTLSVERNIWN